MTDVFFDQDVRIVFISDADLVPDEYQTRLITLLHVASSAAFEIGDIAVELCKKNLESGLVVTDSRVYEAVGRFCGKAGRTVRYYAEAAAFYDRSVRSEFDMLPFAHFVVARQFGERWREVLEYAAEVPGITADELRAVFVADHKSGEISPDYTPGADADSTAGTTPERGEISPLIAELRESSASADAVAAVRVLSVAKDIVARLLRLLPSLEVDGKVYDDVAGALETLERSLPVLARSVVQSRRSR